MQSSTVTLALSLAAGIAGASNAESQANPLGQVLDLMTGLSAKITKEAEVEAAAFKEYFEWCDDVSKNKNFAIKTASAEQERLEASIAELSAQIVKFDSEIESRAQDIATSSADLKSATTIREKETADFASSETELKEVVDTLSRASTILQREMQKNPAALAQVATDSLKNVMQALSSLVDAASLSVSDKQRLASLVQSHEDDDDDSTGAPAAAMYKSHSTSIVDLISDLQDKAETQLSELRKAEVGAKHNYAMLKQSIEDQLANDNKEMEAAKTDKASAEEGKAIAEGDLDVTVADLKATKEALEKANASCMTVASDHDATVRARDAELKVIAEAIKILKSTTDGAVSRVYSLIQVEVRLHSHADLAKSEVLAYIKKLAKQHHSAALAQLVSRVSSVMRFGSGSADPFAKVKGLIQDMIGQLQAEAQAEATEKQFCDEEMATTAAKKNELDTGIEKLTTKLDQASARSTSLKAEVKELQAELAKMAAEQAEAGAVRASQHAVYLDATADLKQGLDGVRGALEVLRNYYAKGGALLQQPEPPMPEAHSAATGAGNSIIGILEVCEDDFATSLTKEETAESEAQEAYDEMTQENKIQTAANNQDVKYKTAEYISLDKSVTELSSDREGLMTQRDAVLEYDQKLKERCIAKPETYEERKEKRQQEIAGLKDALDILENEVAFVQRKGKRHGLHMRGSALLASSH